MDNLSQSLLRWNRGFSGYFSYCTIGSSTFGSILFRQFPNLLPADKFHSNPSCLPDNCFGDRNAGGITLAGTFDSSSTRDACFPVMDKKSAILKPGSQIVSMADPIGVCDNYFSVLSCLPLHPKDGSIFKSDAIRKVTLQKAITMMKNMR